MLGWSRLASLVLIVGAYGAIDRAHAAAADLGEQTIRSEAASVEPQRGRRLDDRAEGVVGRPAQEIAGLLLGRQQGEHFGGQRGVVGGGAGQEFRAGRGRAFEGGLEEALDALPALRRHGDRSPASRW